MLYVAIGCLGFLLIHLLNIVSLKRLPGTKPLIWILGNGLLIYALVMAYLQSGRILLPTWPTWLGWTLLIISLLLLIHHLFINIPFRKTYIATGVGNKLLKTGLYALVRHPAILWFILLILSSISVLRSSLLLIAAPIIILLDLALVTIQDKVFFIRMCAGYKSYQRETPIPGPNPQSLNTFVNSLKQPSGA